MANEKKDLGVATGEATATPMNVSANEMTSQREFSARGGSHLAETIQMLRARGEQNIAAIRATGDWRQTRIEGLNDPGK